MTFEIPLSVQANLNRRHREGVPVAESVAEGPEQRELVTWRGVQAWYLESEKAALRGLPAKELWVAHCLKAELDATVVDET